MAPLQYYIVNNRISSHPLLLPPAALSQYTSVRQLFPDGLPHLLLGRVVQGRKTVVENVEIGLSNQPACDGNTLLLTPRKIDRILRDIKIQSLLGLAEEIAHLNHIQHLPNLIIRRIFFTRLRRLSRMVPEKRKVVWGICVTV